jgi:transcriptional regulator with XRE-family HTH domain
MPHYPNRIKELRTSRGITQLQLSMELECTQESISAYENGRTLPSVTILMKMSEIFNTSMDYIMKRSDVPSLVDTQNISKDEKRLLSYYRILGQTQKERSIAYMQGMIDTQLKY